VEQRNYSMERSFAAAALALSIPYFATRAPDIVAGNMPLIRLSAELLTIPPPIIPMSATCIGNRPSNKKN
jgi:hypothetical protein